MAVFSVKKFSQDIRQCSFVFKSDDRNNCDSILTVLNELKLLQTVEEERSFVVKRKQTLATMVRRRFFGDGVKFFTVFSCGKTCQNALCSAKNHLNIDARDESQNSTEKLLFRDTF